MSADRAVIEVKRHRAERFGREITELFGRIAAATCDRRTLPRRST